MKVLNRYKLKHANRSNKQHLRRFSRTRNYSVKAFQVKPWWEFRYSDGFDEWTRWNSLLPLFPYLYYLNQILVHVFWYKISSRCIDTSVSKALNGWSHRSPSSPPFKTPSLIISTLYSTDFRFTANPSAFLSQLLSHLLSQSEVRYERLSRLQNYKVWKVSFLLLLHTKRP